MDQTFDFLVIIPTYKRRGPLRAVIESVLSQTGVSKKIIVADDCPDASAMETAADFPDILYLRNPMPSGGWPGRVRNFAFDTSGEVGIKAHYVHFLDDDDTVPAGHYQVAKQTFEQHPDIGVVFGVLRPFCRFSEDPDRRRRQEQQLQKIQNWRYETGRFPWLYDHIGAAVRLPILTQWLYRQHAMFGSEMFLCSGGLIRYCHVVELGGFPDIRITQDYWFYTEAIRRFQAAFLRRETAGYGVGDPGAIWNPLDPDEQAIVAHRNEWMQELYRRQRQLLDEMGFIKYNVRKMGFRLGETFLKHVVMPVLDRFGYFADLYQITNSRQATSSFASGRQSSFRKR